MILLATSHWKKSSSSQPLRKINRSGFAYYYGTDYTKKKHVNSTSSGSCDFPNQEEKYEESMCEIPASPLLLSSWVLALFWCQRQQQENESRGGGAAY